MQAAAAARLSRDHRIRAARSRAHRGVALTAIRPSQRPIECASPARTSTTEPKLATSGTGSRLGSADGYCFGSL